MRGSCNLWKTLFGQQMNHKLISCILILYPQRYTPMSKPVIKCTRALVCHQHSNSDVGMFSCLKSHVNLSALSRCFPDPASDCDTWINNDSVRCYYSRSYSFMASAVWFGPVPVKAVASCRSSDSCLTRACLCVCERVSLFFQCPCVGGRTEQSQGNLRHKGNVIIDMRGDIILKWQVMQCWDSR